MPSDSELLWRITGVRVEDGTASSILSAMRRRNLTFLLRYPDLYPFLRKQTALTSRIIPKAVYQAVQRQDTKTLEQLYHLTNQDVATFLQPLAAAYESVDTSLPLVDDWAFKYPIVTEWSIRYHTKTTDLEYLLDMAEDPKFMDEVWYAVMQNRELLYLFISKSNLLPPASLVILQPVSIAEVPLSTRGYSLEEIADALEEEVVYNETVDFYPETLELLFALYPEYYPSPEVLHVIRELDPTSPFMRKV